MIAKKHVVEGKIILALCDSGIFGKKFEEGERLLDLSCSFYKGKDTSEEDILKILADCYLVNAVGRKSVEFLKANKIIDDANILFINNIPYVQIIIKE